MTGIARSVFEDITYVEQDQNDTTAFGKDNYWQVALKPDAPVQQSCHQLVGLIESSKLPMIATLNGAVVFKMTPAEVDAMTCHECASQLESYISHSRNAQAPTRGVTQHPPVIVPSYAKQPTVN